VALSLRLEDASSDLLVRHVRILRDCVALAQKRWGFDVDAAAVLPSELHLLCCFPDTQFAIGNAARLIASAFAHHVPAPCNVAWSHNSDVTEIAHSAVKLRRDFIENAPVRAGLVRAATDWPYSSANRASLQGGEFGVAVA